MGRAGIAGAIAVTAFALSIADASAGPATVEVVPAKALLSPDRPTAVRVVVTNQSARTLKRVRVRPLAAGTSGLDLDVVPDEVRQIKPGSTRTWRMVVQPRSDAAEARTVTAVVRYATRADAGGRTSGIAQASVELSPAPAIDPAKVASLDLLAALATIRSGKSEDVYLRLTNKASIPVEAGKVDAQTPGFLSVHGGDQTRVVPPGATQVIPLTVTAEDRVRPGKYQLVFTMSVTPEGSKRPVVLTAEKAVDVAVSGESEVLSPFGIPALFILPGFLVLGTMSILWTLRPGRKKWDSEAFPFEMKSAQFWVIAVGLSLALTAAMSPVLGIDLFDRYGLLDIAIVWVVSSVLGAIVYAVWVFLRNRSREARTPSENDSPIETLEKLHNQHLDVRRERYGYQSDNVAKVLYSLQDANGDRPATWMSPAIDFTWKQSDPQLEKRIKEALDISRDAGALARALKDGEAAHKLTVEWATESLPVKGPLLVDKQKIGAAHGADVLVHEQ